MNRNTLTLPFSFSHTSAHTKHVKSNWTKTLFTCSLKYIQKHSHLLLKHAYIHVQAIVKVQQSTAKIAFGIQRDIQTNPAKLCNSPPPPPSSSFSIVHALKHQTWNDSIVTKRIIAFLSPFGSPVQRFITFQTFLSHTLHAFGSSGTSFSVQHSHNRSSIAYFFRLMGKKRERKKREKSFAREFLMRMRKEKNDEMFLF